MTMENSGPENRGQTKSLIKAIFVPRHCIQGEEYPLTITWDKSKTLTIRITLPEGFSIKEIHNVGEGGVETRDNQIVVEETEVNGYLGIVVQSKFRDAPRSVEPVILEVTDDLGQTETIERNIHFFRPEVELLEIPEEIHIRYDTKREKLGRIEGRIILANSGEGTAFISFKEDKESELHVRNTKDVDSFSSSFWEDMEGRLDPLKESFPDSADVLDSFLALGKNPPDYDKDGIERIKSVFSALTEAFEADESFLEEFAKAIVSSYMSNLQFMTEIESFVNYLRSIAVGGIVIGNALSVVGAGEQAARLVGELNVTDLAMNSHPSISVDVKIRSSREVELPLYLIFDTMKYVGER